MKNIKTVYATHVLYGDVITFRTVSECANYIGCSTKDVKRAVEHGGMISGYEITDINPADSHDEDDIWGDDYE